MSADTEKLLPWPSYREYFSLLKTTATNITVLCSICRKEYSASKTSSSNLRKHLEVRSTFISIGIPVPDVCLTLYHELFTLNWKKCSWVRPLLCAEKTPCCSERVRLQEKESRAWPRSGKEKARGRRLNADTGVVPCRNQSTQGAVPKSHRQANCELRGRGHAVFFSSWKRTVPAFD